MDEGYDRDEDFDYFDSEPDLDFGFEFDSAMDSIGWGDDDGGDLAPAWEVL